jgi:hypothetical protein
MLKYQTQIIVCGVKQLKPVESDSTPNLYPYNTSILGSKASHPSQQLGKCYWISALNINETPKYVVGHKPFKSGSQIQYII